MEEKLFLLFCGLIAGFLLGGYYASLEFEHGLKRSLITSLEKEVS